ncbi:hypothetical protein VTI74DRAFT_6401 [Chaetomium olivicolor]
MTLNAASAVSCVECQRRKQKCNREFPCNHCLKRGVSHLCRFVTKTAGFKNLKDERAQDGQSRTSRKRSLCSPENGGLPELDPEHDDASDIDVNGALNGLGYMSHHHHLVLGQGPGPKAVRDVVEESDEEQSEELKSVLPLMPEKRYTDCLMDNWASGANHHYYALFPSEFKTQYEGWWATPRNKVTPELTSLIFRVCACSLHFIIDDSVRARLETELHTDVLTFANRMHAAAEKLSATIPPGKGGLIHVQQLFLTAFWLKSAEKWTEAWHALSRAIRAANEIGLHQNHLAEGLSEFDREMRRRVWVILYLWDFALGSMLSRPLLINHADCTVEMPTLTLENNPERPGLPSPFRHMVLHCQLCMDLAAQLGGPSDSDADKAEIARRMRGTVEEWFANLPAEYALEGPDTRFDAELNWVVFQRRYLHLIGYMSLFAQLRPFLTKSSAKPMSNLEATLRAAGVDAALGLMEVSWSFFENLASVGAKFHYAIFCIFDSATVMCSAFVQDTARSLPQRERVLEAINKGVTMLGEVYRESKTTAALYRILKGLLAKLPLDHREQEVIGATKRVKNQRTPPPTDTVSGTTRPMKNPSLTASRRRRSRHRSSSASSGSDTTLDSSNCQPHSDSSVSVPDSCRSIKAGSSSDGQRRRGSILPSHALPSVDSLPSSSSFALSAPPHVAYPSTPDTFMLVTTAMPTNVYVASEGYAGTPAGFVQPSGFQYSHSLSPAEAVPFSQPSWQSSQVPVSPMDNSSMSMFQSGGGNLAGFDSTTPSVLNYWEWQTLGLGHPMSWAQPGAGMNGHGGNPQDHGLPGGYAGRVIMSDGRESSAADLNR